MHAVSRFIHTKARKLLSIARAILTNRRFAFFPEIDYCCAPGSSMVERTSVPRRRERKAGRREREARQQPRQPELHPIGAAGRTHGTWSRLRIAGLSDRPSARTRERTVSPGLSHFELPVDAVAVPSIHKLLPRRGGCVSRSQDVVVSRAVGM
jgi:hypothetical protein